MSKPERHTENTKQQILAAAYELFFSLGYKQTTIRKIIQKAGVRNGSLYHFYANKDDIFSHLVMSLLSICRQRAEELTKGSVDSLLAYCLDTALKIQVIVTYPMVCELFSDAFSSWESMRVVLDCAVSQDMPTFAPVSRNLTKEDCFMKEVVAYGSLRGLLQAGYNKVSDFRTLLRYQLSTALNLFGVESPESDDLIRRTATLIDTATGTDIFEYARKKLQDGGI